jgi:hypothetical protein
VRSLRQGVESQHWASNPSDKATIPECQGYDRRSNAILPGSQVSIRIDKGAILVRDAGVPGSRAWIDTAEQAFGAGEWRVPFL